MLFDLQISISTKQIFQITTLSLKFESVIYCYWQEISISIWRLEKLKKATFRKYSSIWVFVKLVKTCNELEKKYFKPPISQTKFIFKSVTPKVGPNFNGDRLHLASLLSLGETTRIMTIVYNIWQPIETFPISLLKIAKTQ